MRLSDEAINPCDDDDNSGSDGACSSTMELQLWRSIPIDLSRRFRSIADSDHRGEKRKFTEDDTCEGSADPLCLDLGSCDESMLRQHEEEGFALLQHCAYVSAASAPVGPAVCHPLPNGRPCPEEGFTPRVAASLQLLQQKRFAGTLSQAGSLGESLRNASRQSLGASSCVSSDRRVMMETPPSAPDAFGLHEVLVKCPAPKRPRSEAISRASSGGTTTSLEF